MGAEFELKFSAALEQQANIKEAFSGQWQEFAMETTYFDTSAGDLAGKRYTLRRRLENGVSVCTVKTPAKDGVRGEWECRCDAIEAAIPMLCKLGAPHDLLAYEKADLTAICGARFTRQALTVSLEGCTAELALDRGVLLGGGKEEPLCEVEVELKSGERSSLIAFSRQLAAQYQLKEENRSKFRRALALARGE